MSFDTHISCFMINLEENIRKGLVMEQLSQTHETRIARFHGILEQVVGVDDLFPPDEGVRESAPAPEPTLPPAVFTIGEQATASFIGEPVLIAA
jgi:hypothetical protein